MPIYEFECKNCGMRIDLIKSFRESDDLPTQGEGMEVTDPCPDHEQHEFKKIITGAPSKMYGDNWSGRKGYW